MHALNSFAGPFQIALTAIALLFLNGSSLAVQPPATSGPPSQVSVSQILDWLPENTETLIVGQEIKLDGPPKTDDEKYYPKPEKIFTGLPLSTLMVMTGSEEPEAKTSIENDLQGRTLTLAVESARKFRGPSGLGGSVYEGCQILVFKEDLGATGEALKKRLKEQGCKSIKLVDQDILTLVKKLENDNWTFFMTQPRPNLIVTATQKQFLQELLQRMQKKGEKPAFPQGLPEWKNVNTKAQFWALRHYSSDNALRDPTYPSGAQGLPFLPKPIGFTFSYDPKHDKKLHMHHLSGSTDVLDFATTLWGKPSRHWKPEYKEKSKGVVEVSAEIEDRERGSSVIMGLLALLGHAVAV
jgi:hypothetical protein